MNRGVCTAIGIMIGIATASLAYTHIMTPEFAKGCIFTSVIVMLGGWIDEWRLLK